MTRYRDLPSPLVVAHRGGARVAPENSLEAFAAALRLGVTALETDVRVTADGVLVAFHDEHLDRVTDLRGRLDATPWERVRRARLRVDGVPREGRVARFEDVLAATGDAFLAVDVKVPAAVRPLAAVLRRHGAAHRVCVAGAWDGRLAAVRAQTGADLTSALGWRAVSVLVGCARAGLGVPRGLGGDASFVHLPLRLGGRDLLADPVLRARVVDRATDLGLRVVAWTVDEPGTVGTLLADGVSGVITDRPDMVIDAPGSTSAQRGDLELA